MNEQIESSPAPEPTEEQKQLAANVTKLMQEDTPVAGCCLTMLLTRQVYYVALQALHERMEELGHKPEDLIESTLISSMAEGARRPFDTRDLPSRAQSHIIPWLIARNASANEQLKHDLRSQAYEDEKKRAASTVSVRFRDSTAEFGLERGKAGRPRMLVGNANIVSWLMSQLSAAPPEEGQEQNQTIRLIATRRNRIDLKKKVTLRSNVEVTGQKWMKKCTSHKRLQQIIQSCSKQLQQQHLDLLLVGDLLSMKEAILLRSPAVVALEQLKIVRRVMEELSCAAVLGVQLSCLPPPPKLGDPKWDLVRQHAEVIAVGATKREDGCWDVMAGDLCLASDVESDEIGLA